MQEKNATEQFKTIISEREKKVKQLQEEIHMLQVKEHTQAAQFVLHSNNNNNNSNNENSNSNTTAVLNEENERLMSSMSSRNNSRNDFTSTRIGSASNNSLNVNNTNNNKLVDREMAPSRHSLRGAKINSRPNSASGNNKDNNSKNDANNSYKKEFEELKLEYHELKTLSKSSDIERTRLLELVKTLQKRLEVINEKLVETEDKYNELRRKSVNLEKQIEKSKLDSSNSSTFI